MLSKLFGSKSQPPKSRKFFPENRLEALLMQAATDFAARTEFIKELLDTDVFILIVPQENQIGQFVAQQGDTMQIKGITLDGKRITPIFSSERRLREFITTQDHLAKLNGRSLFSMLANGNDGAFLNPGAAYGKEFTKQEIVSLANGTYFEPKQQVIQKETKVLIGMPKEYPSKVIYALRNYFRGNPNVKKAYFAQIHMPDSGEHPHLIFGIEADGDFQQIARDLNMVFLGNLGDGNFADVVQVGKSNLDNYFKNQKPFYDTALYHEF